MNNKVIMSLYESDPNDPLNLLASFILHAYQQGWKHKDILDVIRPLAHANVDDILEVLNKHAMLM